MSPVLWLLAGSVAWLALATPVAVLIGRCIARGCPCDSPDGSAGDLLADVPPEVLTVDEAFRALTDPLEAERDARLRGRVIRP